MTRERAQQLASRPLRLTPNRVWRIYRGGRLIDELRGAPEPADGFFPEDWAASDTVAMNEGREDILEGPSQVLLEGEGTVPLPEVLQVAPEACLGPAHVSCFGSKLGLLVKLLDSAERLQIQAHPSPDFSRAHLGDTFGKTESWLVLGTRPIDSVDPYILLGFAAPMTKATLGDLIERQDSVGMEQALNRVPVRPGDRYILRAGVPHAIGPGVFMVEVQEPTDWVVSAEFQVGQVRLSRQAALMGLPLETALDVFVYDGPTGEAAVQDAWLAPRPGHSPAETVLVGSEDTPCFSAHELAVHGDVPEPQPQRAYSGVVTAGSGAIVGPGYEMPLHAGDCFFVPYAAQRQGYRSAGGMTIITSFPPTVEER